MIGAGIGMVVLGYAFAYSGISNITNGGNGWGFIRSLTGKGGNTSTGALEYFVQGIQPQGNSGSDTQQAEPPVKGSEQV